MSENKKYQSVSELINEISEDVEFNDELHETINNKSLATLLFSIRSAMGVSQEKVADELGCSQSCISKLENGNDSEISIKHLKAYGKALNCDFSLSFSKRETTSVDKIKFCMNIIKEEFSNMAVLANKDDKIALGVAKVLFTNFLDYLEAVNTTFEKLPINPNSNSPYLHINIADNLLPRNKSNQDGVEIADNSESSDLLPIA